MIYFGGFVIYMLYSLWWNAISALKFKALYLTFLEKSQVEKFNDLPAISNFANNLLSRKFCLWMADLEAAVLSLACMKLIRGTHHLFLRNSRDYVKYTSVNSVWNIWGAKLF